MAASLQPRVVTGANLPGEKELLATVQALVNKCYNPQQCETMKPRYHSPDEIYQEIGEDGFLVAIVDPTAGGAAVAAAGVKRWRTTTPRIENGIWYQNWEIGPAATLNTPEYRKKGLIDRCLQALYDSLLEREPEARIKLWIK